MSNSFVENKLELKVFSGFCSKKSPDFAAHSKLFEFWKEFWTEVYTQADSLEAFSVDDFYRQQYIYSVWLNDEPFGICMSSTFEIDSPVTQNHSYFKFYSEDVRRRLKDGGFERIVSFEFLTASKDWRKVGSSISLGEVMVGLITRHFLYSRADCGLAVARTDVRAKLIANSLGLLSIERDLMRKNFPIDVVLCTAESYRPNASPVTEGLVQRLWETRDDLREYRLLEEIQPTAQNSAQNDIANNKPKAA